MVTIATLWMGLKRSAGSYRSAAIIINATITRDDPTCKLLNSPPPLGSFFGEGEDYRGGHPSNYVPGAGIHGGCYCCRKEREKAVAELLEIEIPGTLP